MNVRRVFACASALGLVLGSQGASAFGMMDVGEWKVEFSGNVNAFLSNVDCSSDAAGPVLAGLACGSLSGGDYKDTNIRTGLLPSWLGFHAERTEGSTKYGVTLGFQPGVDSNSPLSSNPLDAGLGLNSSNFRQVFLEFSGGWGGIKVGRDLGIFGSDAILSDMTLLGVGTVSDLAAGGGNTTLGRIGVGYLYADWKGQIQYSSPKFGGFSFNIAIVDPWGMVNLSGLSQSAGSFDQEAPDLLASNGWEGKINYSWEGDFSGKLWASFIYQKIERASNATPVPGLDDETADGFDVGAKVGFGGFEGVAYYYTGKGIGTTDFLFDAMALNGNVRDSDGYYAQVTFKIPGPKTKIGVSYGESHLDLADGEANSPLVDKNKSYVIGIYHPMTSALNLVLEYTDTKAEAHNGNEAEEKAIAIGAILFF